jgi:BolA protein
VSLKDWMVETLTRSLDPTDLAVEDESHLHEGHGGWRPSGETHFRINVVSAVFAGKSRVERHRIVNEQMGEAFQRGLHALAISAKAPGE